VAVTLVAEISIQDIFPIKSILDPEKSVI